MNEHNFSLVSGSTVAAHTAGAHTVSCDKRPLIASQCRAVLASTIRPTITEARYLNAIPSLDVFLIRTATARATARLSSAPHYAVPTRRSPRRSRVSRGLALMISGCLAQIQACLFPRWRRMAGESAAGQSALATSCRPPGVGRCLVHWTHSGV